MLDAMNPGATIAGRSSNTSRVAEASVLPANMPRSSKNWKRSRLRNGRKARDRTAPRRRNCIRFNQSQEIIRLTVRNEPRIVNCQPRELIAPPNWFERDVGFYISIPKPLAPLAIVAFERFLKQCNRAVHERFAELECFKRLISASTWNQPAACA